MGKKNSLDRGAARSYRVVRWADEKIIAGGQGALEIFFKRSSHTIAGFYVALDNDLSNLAACNHFGGDCRCETK